VLRDVTVVDTTTTVLGRPAALPLVLAPTGFTRMMHHQGERAVVRVAEAVGIPYARRPALAPQRDHTGPIGRPGTASLDQPTSCLQSQIGRGRHLRRYEAAQVEAALALSVVVRWGPVLTAVSGTLVARPARQRRCSLAA
jgi:hypothetical protein